MIFENLVFEISYTSFSVVKKRSLKHQRFLLHNLKNYIFQKISLCSENQFSEQDVQFVSVTSSGRDPTTIATAAGKGESEKMKSSKEERTHSCALLRRPTTSS